MGFRFALLYKVFRGKAGGGVVRSSASLTGRSLSDFRGTGFSLGQSKN